MLDYPTNYYRKLNDERQYECSKVLDLEKDKINLRDFMISLKTMPALKLDVEITHNILRNMEYDIRETIEEVDHEDNKVTGKDYSSSLLGTKLIMESILNSNEKFGKFS